MQAYGTVCFTGALPLKSSKSPSSSSSYKPRIKRASSLALTKASPGSPGDAASAENVIDYSSSVSYDIFPCSIYKHFCPSKAAANEPLIDGCRVFPAEACETIGGEACNVTIYPEARLEASRNSAESNVVVEEIDREYLDYNQLKTVFPGEACDDLGGEFCGDEYQMGVCEDRTLT